MSLPIDLMFKLSCAGALALITSFPALAEIPITGGEVRGGYILDSAGDVDSVVINSFILRTPNGNLASPTTTFDNPRDALAPFLDSPRASVTVNLNGTAFTPNGEVVMFRGIPTVIQGYLDPNSVVGANTSSPSGTVIVDGGAFNVGNTTVNSNGTAYQDSTLSFQAPTSAPTPAPTPAATPVATPDPVPNNGTPMAGGENPPEITDAQEITFNVTAQEVFRQAEEQRQALNSPATERPDSMPSRIYPAASMRQ